MKLNDWPISKIITDVTLTPALLHVPLRVTLSQPWEMSGWLPNGWWNTRFVLWEVCDESDVRDDQLVLQQQVFEEDVFLLQRDGLRAEQAHQQLRTGTLQTGSTGTISWLLRKAQWLQYTVLTWGGHKR